MYIKIVLLILSLTCYLSSCMNNENESLIRQAQQAEIRIPFDSLRCLHSCRNNDTRNYMGNGEYIYVVYSDSTICSLCELQRMGIWNGIIKRTHEIGVAVDFMFIFNPPKNKVAEFIDGYYSHKFNLTIFVDTIGIMQKKNTILKNAALHSFIVNRDNRIVKIGDASKNAEVEQEFYKFIKKSRYRRLLRTNINGYVYKGSEGQVPLTPMKFAAT